jgi:glycosyltransferase involved in cell wall biosynthesis
VSDKSQPLVSILVPSFNSEPYLSECVASALAQTHRNIEVIIVDDGSTDASLQLARGFADDRVRVIAQENRGQAGALNNAYAEARGDYIQYLDADDVLHPGKIEHQLPHLRNADPMAIASGAWARFSTAISDANFVKEAVWQDLSPADWLVTSWSGGGMMHVAAWLIPRAVVEAAGLWKESLRWAPNLDAHFFTRTMLASSVCLFCADAISYYRSGIQSMSSWRSRQSVEAMIEVILDCGEGLLRLESSDRTRAAFADVLQRYVYAVYPDHPDLVDRAEARIEELGGSRLAITGGPMTVNLSKFFGWKLAKRLRRLAGAVP